MWCKMVDIAAVIISALLDPIGTIITFIKFFLGFFVLGILIAIAFLLNIAFGINIGQISLDLIRTMIETMRNTWLWIVETFHYDNTKQIFALSLICFILMVFLFMAFNINQTGAAGKVSFGSGAVRGSDSGSEGAGGYFTGGEAGGITATSLPTTVTSMTIPWHCYNSMQDYDEEEIDCGGIACVPCHCIDREQNEDEAGIDCGGVSCAPCTCDPTGLNVLCRIIHIEGGYDYYPYCCPAEYGNCSNHCVNHNNDDEEEARFFCNHSICIGN